MIRPFDRKILAVTPPAAISDNASPATNVIDTIGYDYCVINVMFGAMDIAMAALKLQESDVKASATALTSGVDVTGAIFGTSNNDTGSASTLPSGTDDNTIVSIFVDLRGGRKRYLDLLLTTGDGAAGTYICAWAELWRGKDAPRTAAEAGYGQRLCV